MCSQLAGLDCNLKPATIREGCPLRIPEIFWKIVYNPDGKKGLGSGLAFIVLNSPCPYKNTALYEKLVETPADEKSPPCSNDNCKQIWKNFKCAMKKEMDPDKGEQVKGLTLCCFKISEALRIMGSDGGSNEISFLPNDIKNNGNRLWKEENLPDLDIVDDF